jgi:hypothetical protein
MYARLADFPLLDEYPSRIPAPVACTVLQYYCGASRVREAALRAIAAELERRLHA